MSQYLEFLRYYTGRTFNVQDLVSDSVVYFFQLLKRSDFTINWAKYDKYNDWSIFSDQELSGMSYFSCE